jgi:hypothetical protein
MTTHTLLSCVTPEGFRYGIHKPSYKVKNLRQGTHVSTLGKDSVNRPVSNSRNFPTGDLRVADADWIYEIPNPFPFKGRTYIDKEWADSSANNIGRICLPEPESVSLTEIFSQNGVDERLLEKLPPAMLLALATTSSDEKDLIKLAERSCDFVRDEENRLGLRYTIQNTGVQQPVIHDHDLFEAVANSPHLPDEYKIAMVIRPGAQGGSEIVGEWPKTENSHVYEYLRRNSYIAGGHYAANMAEDAVRYSIKNLEGEDICALRHLYYQRTFIRLAQDLEIETSPLVQTLSGEELEQLRSTIVARLKNSTLRPATLWGWNFGFDFAPTRYRLHASHQQIHQQYAMVPEQVESYGSGSSEPRGHIPAYSSGDLIASAISQYKTQYKRDFFSDYLLAIQSNTRMDGRIDLNGDLAVWADDNVLLFVPKAQTSQWELQLITLPQATGQFPGNVVECDTASRSSLDTAILIAQKALAGLGAQMVTTIEYSKRINSKMAINQPLLYSFLPKLPQSPGAFSEAQLRFINGHYPEDFAEACRRQI